MEQSLTQPSDSPFASLVLLVKKKKILAVLMAIQKWKHYLSLREFIIKTDHESLKYLLEQKITHYAVGRNVKIDGI